MIDTKALLRSLLPAISGLLAAGYIAGGMAVLVMQFNSSSPVTNAPWFMWCYQWIILPVLVLSCLFYLMTTYLGRAEALFPVIASGLALLGIGFRDIRYYHEIVPIVVIALVCMVIEFVLGRAVHANRAQAVAAGDQAEDELGAGEGIRFVATRSNVNYSRVVGMSELKERLLDAGSEIVNSQTSAKSREARNGILLYGDPGNGKTYFAAALAGELKLPFISVSNSDLASKWINNTTENVAKLFADARAQAPCLLFIDEIDSLITSRENSLGNGYEEGPRITNALLTELVNIRRHKVVVVAATNFFDQLDSAAVREGRFDFKIEVTPPDREARIGLINSSISGFEGITLLPAAIDQAANRWEGYSVARIRAVIEEAGRASRSASTCVIDYAALQISMRKIQGNQGDRLPEDTPLLRDLTMEPAQREKLVGITHRMANIEEVEELGGTVPTGVLFMGPPGTGKTLSVRAMAKETNWALICTSGADLMAKTDAIDKLVARAKNIRPCIIFIDEADDVLGDRRSGNVATITNKLLAAIDGAKGKVPDLVWVAATNHPDAMDSAALRGGRFTEKIEFKTADLSGATTLVKNWMNTTKAALSNKLHADEVGALLEGESPANINAILQQSINNMIERRASGNGQDQVTYDDLVNARRIVIGA